MPTEPNMQVFVTGANGFIGSNLCRRLLNAGHEVSALVRENSDRGFLAKMPDLRLVVGDITRAEDLARAMAGAEVVFHVAGLASDWGDWQHFVDVNVTGTANVIHAARANACKRVVHVSSVSVYGFPGLIDVGEDFPFVERPDNAYITTKAAGERLALAANDPELEVVVIRPAGVYGPNDRTTTLQIVPAMLSGKFGYVDGGRHRMAPVYIDNLVDLMLLAAVHEKAPGEAFNAIDDGYTNWRQYCEMMCRELGCKPPFISLPHQLAWPAAVALEKTALLFKRRESPPINTYRIRAVMADSHYSMAKARRVLGYSARFSTQQGIQRTIAWYRRYEQEHRKAAA